MTRLGEFLEKKSVCKADIARKTGLSKSRLSELTLNHTTKLRADELYLIALAVSANPGDVLEFVCEGVMLKNQAA